MLAGFLDQTEQDNVIFRGFIEARGSGWPVNKRAKN